MDSENNIKKSFLLVTANWHMKGHYLEVLQIMLKFFQKASFIIKLNFTYLVREPRAFIPVHKEHLKYIISHTQ